MPKLEYQRSVFMMCYLKLSVLSCQGFSSMVLSWPFLSHEAQCTSLIGKDGQQKCRNTLIYCLLCNLLLPLLKVCLNIMPQYWKDENSNFHFSNKRKFFNNAVFLQAVIARQAEATTKTLSLLLFLTDFHPILS